MAEVKFSFIYVNFQSATLLEEALLLLRSATETISHEIIIVNNDIGEQRLLDKLGEKHSVRIQHLPANCGYGKANNVGASMAQGDILVFLNPDTRFRSGNLESLHHAFAFHPDGVFGLRLEDKDGHSEAWSCGYRPRLWTMLVQKVSPWVFRRRLPWQSTAVRAVDWVSGAALSIRKNTFSELQGFDENFFLYYEDVDLCLRARDKGLPVFSYPFLKWRHLRGQSHTSYRSMKEKYFEGQRRYFEKHGAWIEKKILFFLQPLYRFFFS